MHIRALYCVLASAGLSAVPLYGCSSEASGGAGGSGSTSVSTGESTSSSTGGSGGSSVTKEEPDYARAFPQDRVPRLDITITQKNWQAMLDDMTSLAGAFGAGGMGGPGGTGGGGMMLPPELIEACNGLKVDDPCKATFMGKETSGKCTDFNGALVCFPGGGGPGGMGGGEFFADDPIYVECDVATEDRSWRHVGVRFKGNSSLASAWGQGIWK